MGVTSIRLNGDGANHAIGAARLACWISFKAPASNNADVLVGSSPPTLRIAPGDWMCLWPMSRMEIVGETHMYNINAVFYQAAVGDSLDVIYFQGGA